MEHALCGSEPYGLLTNILRFILTEGLVRVHENHHLWSKARIARALPDGQFEVVYTTDLLEPNPFPKGYQ